jgi:hypothetical protein
MVRSLPLLAALTFLAGDAYLYALWTGWWKPSRELEQAVARLEGVPLEEDSCKEFLRVLLSRQRGRVPTLSR